MNMKEYVHKHGKHFGDVLLILGAIEKSKREFIEWARKDPKAAMSWYIQQNESLKKKQELEKALEYASK